MLSARTAHANMINILLVEDNEADVVLTQEAFKEAKTRNALSVARDGVEAMEFLRRQGRYRTSPRPDLILLDLNMPRMSGREVLDEVKRDPSLRSIPVVVLTTSQADDDIATAYDAHANCFITKPVDFSQFMQVIQAIESFWLTIVKLPEPQTDSPIAD